MGEAVVALLAPLLPVLFSRAADAIASARRSHGEEKVGAADELWRLLQPHLRRDNRLHAALQQLAEEPADHQAKALVAQRLEGLFGSDPPLKEAGDRLLEVNQQQLIAGRDIVQGGVGAGGVGAFGGSMAAGRDNIRMTAPDPYARIRRRRPPRGSRWGKLLQHVRGREEPAAPDLSPSQGLRLPGGAPDASATAVSVGAPSGSPPSPSRAPAPSGPPAPTASARADAAAKAGQAERGRALASVLKADARPRPSLGPVGAALRGETPAADATAARHAALAEELFPSGE